MRRRSILSLAVLLALFAALGAASAAQAGSYFINELGAWQSTAGPGLAVGNDGRLIARNQAVAGQYVPRGSTAEWRLNAPPYSRVFGATVAVNNLQGGFGWQVVFIRGTGVTSQVCGGSPGPACSLFGTVALQESGGGPGFAVQLRCDADQCPLSPDPVGQFVIADFDAQVANDTPPTNVALAGGNPALAGKWVRGTLSVPVSATDDVGIRKVTAVLDGTQVGATDLPCAPGHWVPCPTSPGATGVAVNLSRVSDGLHLLAGQATDSADNQQTTPQTTVKVDNTPPTAPEGIALEGGAGWRTINAFTVRWTNPQQSFAPLAGANYEICRADGSDCVSSSVRAPEVAALALTVPGPGVWTLRLHLVDEAGNADPAASVVVGGLGYDPTPPSVAIQRQDPREPARIVAIANDAESGIANGSIEIRRRGSRSWRQVDTRVTPNGLTAVLPDRRFKRGRYTVRGIASNAAGLAAAASLRGAVDFPIRARSRLIGGHPTTRKHRRHLARTVSPRIGQSVTLRGRLAVKGRPMPRRTIYVSARTAIEGARFTPAGKVRTDKRGRYVVRLPAGPARTVRLEYAGGARIADDRVDVEVRVRSRLRLRVDRPRVRNGESIRLTGRVAGGLLPPDGVQLALQVRTRGKWRPFATPRTDAAGRFAFPYRFETVLGTARFRFRAVVLKGATYPYYGRSDERRVVVRGL